MGFIRAEVSAVRGTLADQWKDFLTIPQDLPPTAAFFPAVARGVNAGRGSDTKESRAIITNGSKIIVPEGYGLLTFQDGELTGLVTEPGAYIWESEDLNSQSVYAGDGFFSQITKQSWERYKFGGRPGSQQLAIFVNLKELPNNKFGTQSPIYWDDAYLKTQVGAITRGSYTLRIVDPIVFTKNFLPAPYLQNGEVFDFTDADNAAANQIFAEVVGSLAGAFSIYTNDSSKGHRMSQIQQDSVGFAQSLSQAVDQSYQWTTDRGITITKVAILAIEYDDATKELLKTVQRADALAGARGNSNLQASVAAGIESAGEVSGSVGVLGLGLAAGGIGLSNLQQPSGGGSGPISPENGSVQPGGGELLTRLSQLKNAFDAGLITQDEYDRVRAQALGI
jgi:membrane protease subunit (stomatin/prohibitin family)